MILFIEVLFYLCKTCLTLYILNSALSIFFKQHKLISNSKKFVIYAIYILIGLSTNFTIYNAWLNIIIRVILVCILSINFVGTIKSKLTVALLWTILSTLLEILIGSGYGFILNTTMTDIVVDNRIRLIASIIHVLVLLILVKSAELVKKKRVLIENVSHMEKLQVGIIPLCSIIILHSLIELLARQSIYSPMIIISCIIIIFINIFFFVLFDRLKLAERIKLENTILKSQGKYYIRLQENAKETFEKVLIIKHDLKYKLLYLESLIGNKESDSSQEIKVTIEKLIENSLTDGTSEYTKNKKINRLLNYKLHSIEGIDIDVRVSVREDVYMDEMGMYTILGNLIDNAIRNFDNSMSNQKSLIIRIVDDCDNLFIKISNPYTKKLKFKNGLPQTDKSDNVYHGLGLKSVKDLVESKNGYFKISAENYIFDIEILLFDEIKHNNS